MSRVGYKMTELGEIPQEWEVKKIADLYSVLTGATPLRGKEEYYLNGNVAWVKTLDLNDRYIYDTHEKITDLALKETSCKVQDEDTVLIAMYGGFNQIGRTGVLKIKAATNQAICSLPPVERMCPDYLNYFLIRNRNVWKNVAASTRKDPNITKGDVEKFSIIVPPLTEQHKIVCILSAIDNQIEQIDLLIQKTKELKKGLMQRLLTKGIGHTEFKQTKIGKIPIEWSIKALSDVAVINPESLANKTDPNLIINYIDIESVSTGKISGFKEFAFGEAPSRARRIVKENDVIISTVRPYLRAFTLVEDSAENMVCSTGFAVIRAVNDNAPEFIYQCTLSDVFLAQLTNKMVGSNYPAVNASDIKETLLPVPSSGEQKKIASILYSVDKQVKEYERKGQRLNVLKKALMQKLLTGKIRVKV